MVVAAARGVQVTAGGADDLGQSPLDGRVDVLVRGEEAEAIREEFLADLREPDEDLVGILFGDDALAGEHLAVRFAAAQIVRPQAPIEAQR